MTTSPDPLDERGNPTNRVVPDPLVAPRSWIDAQPPVPGPGFPAATATPSVAPQGWNVPPTGTAVPTAPAPTNGWVPAPQVNPLPTVDAEYHQLWRTPLWRWWRPVVAIGLFLVLALVVSAIASGAAIAGDLASGRITAEDMAALGTQLMTPLLFLANNLAIAAFIPIAWVCAILLFKQRPGWLSSVVGRLRWRWLGLCLAIVTPIWIVWYALETWLVYSPEELGELAVNSDTWLLVIGILLTTPFQAAGEEIAIRGALTRGVASFFTNRMAGLVVAAVVSSLTFMAIHFATDIWLNIFYFSFGMLAAWLTWRTGGLEAAIAIHVVNNLVAEALLPFSDISGIFDRSAGVAGPEVLIQVVVLVAAVVIIDLVARRKGVARVFRASNLGLDQR